MNYIYDIYLNLNENLYDFFDWNKNDKLIRVKKIPIIKISEDKFHKLVSNKIIIDKSLLSRIYNKCELFDKNNKLEYACLFSDSSNIIAICFNENGKSIKKSFLSVDDELEVLEIVDKLKQENIEFKTVCKEKQFLKTRKQLADEKFIANELKNIDVNKLNYIYLECFGKKENNKKTIMDNIKKVAKNSKTYEKLYNILKLTSTTKK